MYESDENEFSCILFLYVLLRFCEILKKDSVYIGILSSWYRIVANHTYRILDLKAAHISKTYYL